LRPAMSAIALSGHGGGLFFLSGSLRGLSAAN
jgi:hypothetical protein